MKMYVAYGSNMNVEQMSRRCPDAKVFGTGLLHGYKIVFRGRSNGVANIEPAEGSTVPVVLWKISPSDEKALDVFGHLIKAEGIWKSEKAALQTIQETCRSAPAP